ncbi:MAG: GNAT family N-acetyltransferase [Candidatus Bathyarchaeota archaeon]|nr:MAG: GNAT family N-acetyltransferase [Candidatus Bathyarchaeota archaeon]
MKIVHLEPALEPIFWEHVNQDVPHYYFFAFDWKYNREKTEIFLALEEGRIEGMMLIYDRSIVQLRGSSRAARVLSERLDLEKVELQSPEEHKSLALRKYKPTLRQGQELMLMLLHKGEETLHTRHSTDDLDASDAEEIAAAMRDADPEYWGEVNTQRIAEGMKRGSELVGIRINHQLVSVGSTRLTEWAGLIGVVATHEDHRNRGYATSIVSELVKRILKKQSLAMIYVLADNPSAIRAYTKVGFKPYKTYFFMRGERR